MRWQAYIQERIDTRFEDLGIYEAKKLLEDSLDGIVDIELRGNAVVRFLGTTWHHKIDSMHIHVNVSNANSISNQGQCPPSDVNIWDVSNDYHFKVEFLLRFSLPVFPVQEDRWFKNLHNIFQHLDFLIPRKMSIESNEEADSHMLRRILSCLLCWLWRRHH